MIVVAKGTKKAAARLDAQIRVGGDAGASEVVVLRLYGALADEGASCVIPLLLPDTPVVAWWPFEAPAVPAKDQIGELANRRITDSANERNPVRALEQRKVSYTAGDTDLAWSRLTKWRAMLAAALDLPPYEKVTAAAVTGEADSPSTDLLAAWLATCLRIPVSRYKATSGEGIVKVVLERRSGNVELERPDAKVGTLVQPGQPPRKMALHRRSVQECLSEELRRLDPDEIYAETLRGLAKVVKGKAATAKPRSVRRAEPESPAEEESAAAAEGVGQARQFGEVEVLAGTGVVVTAPEVIVHADADLLAAAAAARLVTAIVDAQSARGRASVVLTGGRTGSAVLAQVNASPARDAVDWQRIDLYWGDERFLPSGDPERNETQARTALLDHIPVPAERVHVMEPSDGRFGDDPDAAAAAYAELLASIAGPGLVPEFDVCLLGVGEEGHVASVFPDSPAVHETERTVVPVRDCPKPPPTRVSLTLPSIRRSREVWLMTTGAAKADAVAKALTGTPEVQLPAAGAQGQTRTLWLIDKTAAAKLPNQP